MLQVIRNDLVTKSKKSGKVLRLEQNTAYAVDKTNLEEFAKQLQADLSRAEGEERGGQQADRGQNDSEEDALGTRASSCHEEENEHYEEVGEDNEEVVKDTARV